MEVHISRCLRLILAAFVLAAIFPAGQARAACTKPTGSAGSLIYSSGFRTYLYCDGAGWVAPVPPGDVTTGLAGWWKLDDGSGTSAADSSGNGNTGTLTGSPLPGWTTGINGGALNFLASGSTYISTGYNTNLGDFTVCAWFNSSSDTASQRIVDKSYSGGFWLGHDTAGTANKWGGGVEESGAPYGINVTLNDGVWHHLCSVRSGTTHTIYGDGGAVTASNTVSAAPVDGSALTLGALTGGGGNYFTGNIDDVRIYNRALNAQDIATLYYATGPLSGDSGSGLIHYWKLDEGSGTTAADAVGTANVTLAGTAAFTSSGKVYGGLGLPNDGTQKTSNTTAPANILGQSKLTMAMWFKRAAANAPVAVGQQNGASGDEIMLSLSSSGNTYVAVGAAGAGNGAYATVTPGSNDSNWHHLAMVFDGTQTGDSNRLAAYLDGVPQTLSFRNPGGPCSGCVPATTTTNALPFYFGDNQGGLDAGTIDEVRIYNRALSLADILTLYTSTATACGSPVGYTGDLLYNNDWHVPQFCNGAAWMPMGPVPGAGGAGCTGPTGSEGAMAYNSDKGFLQYCDGATWIAIGTGYNGPQQGLVAWWKFDDGAGTSAADSSGNSNTGTLVNTPTWTTSGMNNGALTFNGSNTYVSVPSTFGLFDNAHNYSVCAWVNTTSLANTAYIFHPRGERDVSLAYFGTASFCNQTFGFGYYNGSGHTSCSSAAATAATWYHLCGVWNIGSSTAQLYVNGLPQGSIATGTPNVTANTIEIGTQYMSGAPHNTWNGLLDDVRIYNRALTASEVGDLYQATGGH
jgi:hypothetical protein